MYDNIILSFSRQEELELFSSFWKEEIKKDNIVDEVFVNSKELKIEIFLFKCYNFIDIIKSMNFLNSAFICSVSFIQH